MEGQVPLFISPRNRVAQFYPQVLLSFFVASYDSEGYGGGIRTRLHAGKLSVWLVSPSYNLHTDRIENIASKDSVVVAYLLVSAERCYRTVV
jgi:hypothetical protein